MTAETTQEADRPAPFPCHCAIPGKHTDDRCAYGNGASGRSWSCTGRKAWHEGCWGCSCACHHKQVQP